MCTNTIQMIGTIYQSLLRGKLKFTSLANNSHFIKRIFLKGEREYRDYSTTIQVIPNSKTYPKNLKQSRCSKWPHLESRLAADWLEKLSSKNFPKERLRADMDMTTLGVDMVIPVSPSHLRQRDHIHILPSFSPDRWCSGSRCLTITVRFPFR
jgi:hypothetical protein